MKGWPNKSLQHPREAHSKLCCSEFTRVIAFSSAHAGHVVVPAWLSSIRSLTSLFIALLWTHVCAGQTIGDPARIEVYVTPYYNSDGPAIDVGPFSKGLASNNEAEFLTTISEMKKSWDNLQFTEVHVAAIQLYNRGFRNEAVYWFYSANYRGRLLATLLDPQKMGSIGDPGFELKQAQNAFHQLVGPYINGYAFVDMDRHMAVIERVKKEGKTIPDLNKIYPGLGFKKKSDWEAGNSEVNEGLSKLLAMIKEKKATIKQQRIENGTEAKFSKLTSKELTNRSNER